MKFGLKQVSALLLIFVVLVVALVRHSTPDRNQKTGNVKTLFMYCAAGVKPPVVAAARDFEKETGIRIQLQYGGSGTLLSSLQASKVGDLYLAGDASYTRIGVEKGVLEEVVPVAYMTPVLAVQKGNPKKIHSLDDLTRSDVRVALGNPEAASIGKQTRMLLTKSGHWDAVKANVTKNGVFKPTVPEVANDIKLGTVDAGVIWDATVNQYDELEAVHVPALDAARKNVTVAVLSVSKQPALALRFARYLNSILGNRIFKAHGYESVDGDVWADAPEITFFAGSVNRRAIESTVKAFQQREGVTVNTVYNGCGILTGQMRTIHQGQTGSGFPDIYMACDRYYLENVKDWFQEDLNVSSASLVIAVPKGNPAGIKTLKDLTRPGVKVAVGQPEQCTIGVLTEKLLQAEGVHDQVMKNVVTRAPSSSLLVPSVSTGSADAAIAYKTDTLAEQDKIEVIPLLSQKAIAIQPIAISRISLHKHLARRLKAAILKARVNFEKAGFTYLAGEAEGK